ncbi:hypothetical protein MAR_026472 [Mya arenaria]|uniref:Transposase Helix-turn-helix domain-containing protein n=1 Tax=Mya arenaria TaxID=6604 RepID=A0ABY7EQM1_MYAAR|nr:hypothetical protein MAR_026472 [Mya arenaria]
MRQSKDDYELGLLFDLSKSVISRIVNTWISFINCLNQRTVMADRGIMVQDLFASKNVAVNTPTMLCGKSQLEPEAVHSQRQAHEIKTGACGTVLMEDKKWLGATSTTGGERSIQATNIPRKATILND